MIHGVIYLIYALGLFQKGLAAVIETQQTVMAAVGEEALLNCQLMQPKDVVRMKWQKVLPNGVENLAFSTKDSAGQVNPDFRDKVEFKDAGLQNSSIVIKNVTEEDEGCYRCVLYTDTDRALNVTTCLQLYELHEPVLHVRESNSPEEAVVSCSATGRPAPTVTLTVPHYNSTSVTNTNATVTVTATAVLPRLRGNSTKVGCAVQVLSGPQIEVFTMIPEVTLSSADASASIFVWVMVVVFVCVAAVIIIWPNIKTSITGLAAVIETQQTVMAAVGEEALLNCQLMQPKDVLQVTWQKVLPDKEQNVATYTKYFGEKVNPDFRDKVEFKYAGLQNSSIVIRRVTEEDEGCYHCLFNTYPDGALTGSTCLQLYELHEPVLHVRESNSPEEAVVSCSATGRPAPTVTLTVPHYNSTSVTNTNATVTVTATAVLPRLHGNSTQVGCAVRVLSGPQIEVFTMIPEVTLSSADVIIFLPKRKHQNRLSHRDSEEIKTQRRTTKDTEEDGTLVAMQDIQPVRRRTLSEKDQTRDQPTPPSSAHVL
ncbi:hypothetical protein ABVT39_025470 [Epinephelus coioides]